MAAFVEDYIEKHYKEPVSIEELAEKIGLSPGYVRSIFKNSKGMTVKAYLSEYRLEKACSLLKNTSLGVGRIGQLVGYDNVSYFCSIFQKRYGKTPNEWRRGAVRMEKKLFGQMSVGAKLMGILHSVWPDSPCDRLSVHFSCA